MVLPFWGIIKPVLGMVYQRVKPEPYLTDGHSVTHSQSPHTVRMSGEYITINSDQSEWSQ